MERNRSFVHEDLRQVISINEYVTLNKYVATYSTYTGEDSALRIRPFLIQDLVQKAQR